MENMEAIKEMQMLAIEAYYNNDISKEELLEMYFDNDEKKLNEILKEAK